MNCKTCETCKWWSCVCGDSRVGTAKGYCHRFPPTRLDKIDADGRHAITSNHDWCGEHSEKP
jgi:hypothetical protein